jgi:hypothetical protein
MGKKFRPIHSRPKRREDGRTIPNLNVVTE